METFYKDIIANAGVSGLFFLAFMLLLKAWTKLIEKLIDTFIEDSRKNHEAIKNITETAQCNIAILARIEQKIDYNAWCPIVKERKRNEQ